MDVNNVLGITLGEILNVIQPSRDDWYIRSQIIEDLQALVGALENLRGAVVEPFGSFVSNLFTQQGDLDISIDLPYNSYIASSGKKQKQTLLREVLKALRRGGGVRRLQFISNARVPILKFESNRQGISCDVSIDNFQGQMKSKLFFWLSRIDSRFRDMILIVKEWAKAHSINDSKTGTLNSYSLCLLVVLHFQTCAPAIFPPLMDIYPGNIVDDLKGVRADAERQIEEICIANITKFSSDKQRVHNRTSLSELFISFLAKFSDISLKASELGICTYMGQWQDIQSNMRWLPKTYALHIEDPFEQPENTARSVSTANLKKISEAFGTTYSMLSASYLDRNSVLATLVGPQTYYYLTGTSLRSFLVHNNGLQFNSSANTATHPQQTRAVNQQQQQKKKQKKNSKRANGKAAMQGTAQSDQVQRMGQPNQTKKTSQPIQMQSQAQITIQPSQMQRPTHPNQVQRPTHTNQMQRPTHTNQMQRPTYPNQMQRPTYPNQMQRPTYPNQMQHLTQVSSQPYQMQNPMQINTQLYQMQISSQPYQTQRDTQPYQMQSQVQRTAQPYQMQSQVQRTAQPYQMQSQVQRTAQPNQMQRPVQPYQMQSPVQRTAQPNQMQSQVQRATTQPNQSRRQPMWRQKSDREA